MKRTRTITVDDGDTKVAITVKITSWRRLARYEVNNMSNNIAGGIMSVLDNTRHLSAYLSEMKVT
jgi:hypothetical protein